ncbi:MAG TPA: aldolase/citrate lyase family protein [Hyphomicrobiales bacterium]|nr:aldolase/citrate lyase family protein [Hyphomicrobiales bacterium]
MAGLPAFDLASGKVHWAAWMSTAEPAVAETLALCGYDAIVFDLQHGLVDPGEVRGGIAAAALGGVACWVRVSVGAFDVASQMLDAGAAGVICAMVDTPEIAQAFVNAAKFPPLGRRSWGPNRALALTALDRDAYLAGSNRRTVALGMIETETALKNLPAILATPGFDGIFVGPNDLAVSLSGGTASDPADPRVGAALDRILAACRDAGKPAGIFANTPAFAADYTRRGFAFVTLGTDLAFLRKGAEAMLAEARGNR